MNRDPTEFNKTRLAPTPSGYLHLGNVISFFITVSLAKKHGAKILLRIDDLDQKRVKSEYIQDIFDTIDFLEIPYDEGPRNLKEFKQDYSQIHRQALYSAAIEELKENNLVFACDCSRKTLLKRHPKRWCTGTCIQRNLPFKKNHTSLRLVTQKDDSISLNLYSKGQTTYHLPGAMEFFMLQKKDSFASYQLASLMDDLSYGVDLVVRGMDLLPSSIAQVYLSNKLKENSFGNSSFYHHQLFKEEGKKLSKSNGSYSIQQMRNAGMKKEAIYQLAAKQLGIAYPVTTIEEFSSHFLLLF
ncbi:glutamate--tRNA ligase family protein [Cyclobacterium qasimii]|uniref:Glutamyl-Q-tRNA synthetase n=2 Tax=Cyclobacterium qasimii TaxID=1350429 RepID=S7VB42_9BACT|nr:glutamate--tRNA ligase family protein [Cyclobacterium qasimii]EPR67455.1 glutamyl-Q-tRNA synthetase [Cyclobacterium qasimii M12-11B]GEO21793.1 tRNA glutamyl-Q(34) synthetase GluQRS [Cyclobacterium qasimii]